MVGALLGDGGKSERGRRREDGGARSQDGLARFQRSDRASGLVPTDGRVRLRDWSARRTLTASPPLNTSLRRHIGGCTRRRNRLVVLRRRMPSIDGTKTRRCYRPPSIAERSSMSNGRMTRISLVLALLLIGADRSGRPSEQPDM